MREKIRRTLQAAEVVGFVVEVALFVAAGYFFASSIIIGLLFLGAGLIMAAVVGKLIIYNYKFFPTKIKTVKQPLQYIYSN